VLIVGPGRGPGVVGAWCELVYTAVHRIVHGGEHVPYVAQPGSLSDLRMCASVRGVGWGGLGAAWRTKEQTHLTDVVLEVCGAEGDRVVLAAELCELGELVHPCVVDLRDLCKVEHDALAARAADPLCDEEHRVLHCGEEKVAAEAQDEDLVWDGDVCAASVVEGERGCSARGLDECVLRPRHVEEHEEEVDGKAHGHPILYVQEQAPQKRRRPRKKVRLRDPQETHRRLCVCVCECVCECVCVCVCVCVHVSP
jgi:hypothetical protein